MFKAQLPAARVIARRLYSTRGEHRLHSYSLLRVLMRHCRQLRNLCTPVRGVRSGTQAPQPTRLAGQLVAA